MHLAIWLHIDSSATAGGNQTILETLTALFRNSNVYLVRYILQYATEL